jgi:hypothetical protein
MSSRAVCLQICRPAGCANCELIYTDDLNMPLGKLILRKFGGPINLVLFGYFAMKYVPIKVHENNSPSLLKYYDFG